MPRVTVVIPNWNGLAHLPSCIGALKRQTFRNFEIVVVDNGSTDGSVEWLRQRAADLRTVERIDNGGFAVAVNAGIAASESELIALLNNDTEADERWLDELVAALDETGYDSAASLMTFYDDPAVVNAAGDVYRMSQAVGANRGSLRQVAEYTQAVRVLGASAGAALYRRTLFDDVGLFDEDFFLIHEDTDLNLRALIAGKRCLYVPAALVRHKMSATIRTRPSSVILRQDMRNRGIVVAKDLPVALVAFAWLAWPWRLFRSTIPIRPSMWHLAPGLVKSLGMRVRSEAEGYRLGLLKRREVWRRQAIPTREVIRWLIRGVGPV